MTTPFTYPQPPLPRQSYFAAADAELSRRFGVTIADLSAEKYIEAGRRLGYAPIEIVSWLAEIDGLQALPAG